MEDRGVKPSLPPSSDWPSSFEHPFSELGQSFGVELSDPEAVREFFTDYERGCRVFGVDVYGDFSEWLAEPVVEFSGLSSRVELYDPVKIDNPEVLLDVLRMMVPLWRNPYLHALIRSDVMKVLYRGVEYRSLILRTKLKIAFASIPRKWFKVKRVDGKYALSRHIVMTITLPKERYRLSEAWLYGIKKRFREIRRFIGRRYGLKGFVAVHEVHKDGYPHLHVIFFTKKWVKVFKHYVRKNGRKCWLWRFDEKREWERALCASEELFKEGSEEFRGFIDAFALRRGKDEAVGYFLKYLEKVEDVSYDIPEDVKVEEFNFKPYSLFVFRIFRVRVVGVSESVRSKMRKYIDLRIEEAKDVLSREKWLRIRMALFKERKDEREREVLAKLYELGAFIKDERYGVEVLKRFPESERSILLERLDILIRELMVPRYPDLQSWLSRRLPSSVLANPCDYVCGSCCLPLLRPFCYDGLMARVFALAVKVYEDRAFFVPLGYCVLRAVS
jgi:hypothetical protein